MSYALLDIPQLISSYGYWGVFIIVFLESGIFFPLPGDSLLFTAGLLASGVGFNLHLLIPLIFIATFLGGMAGYMVGVYLEHFRTYPLLGRFLKDKHIKSGHEFFERHGKAAVLLSRFVPVVRTFVPIVAGVVRMDIWKFVRYSLLSSLLWSTSVTLLGYFLGREFPTLQNYLHYIAVLIVLGSLIPLAFEWYRERRRRRVS